MDLAQEDYWNHYEERDLCLCLDCIGMSDATDDPAQPGFIYRLVEHIARRQWEYVEGYEERYGPVTLYQWVEDDENREEEQRGHEEFYHDPGLNDENREERQSGHEEFYQEPGLDDDRISYEHYKAHERALVELELENQRRIMQLNRRFGLHMNSRSDRAFKYDDQLGDWVDVSPRVLDPPEGENDEEDEEEWMKARYDCLDPKTAARRGRGKGQGTGAAGVEQDLEPPRVQEGFTNLCFRPRELQ